MDPHLMTVLTVDGMMCQKACGTTVERALSAVKGVQDASASFATHSAQVTWISLADINVDILIDAIDSVGFEAQHLKPVFLAVDGMMCQKACGTTVERALNQTPGVLVAVASFQKSMAACWGENLDLNALIDVIESVGFGASAHSDVASDDDPVEVPDTTLRVKGMFDKANCPRKVHDTLMSVDGVLAAKVNFDKKIVETWGFADKQALIDALVTAGFAATDKNEKIVHGSDKGKKDLSSTVGVARKPGNADHFLELKIGGLYTFFTFIRDTCLSAASLRTVITMFSGMFCANCVRAVENGLIALDGVTWDRSNIITYHVERDEGI